MTFGDKVFFGGLVGVGLAVALLIGSKSIGVILLAVFLLLLAASATFWGVFIKWGPNFMGKILGAIMEGLNKGMEEVEKQTKGK